MRATVTLGRYDDSVCSVQPYGNSVRKSSAPRSDPAREGARATCTERAAGFDSDGMVSAAVALPPRTIAPERDTSRRSPKGRTGTANSTASLSAAAIAVPVKTAEPTVSALNRQSRRCSPADGTVMWLMVLAETPPGPLEGVTFFASRLTASDAVAGR